MDENLDAGLVDIVAAAVLIVDPQDRLDITQEVAAMDERLDRLGDEGRAAQSTADQHLKSDFALRAALQAQPDVVNLDRGAVVRRSRDGKFEFARQKREFRMERGVLPEQLRPDAGILDF